MTKDMTKTTLTDGLESQFKGLLSLIERKRSEASRAVNEKQLMTAWVVGGYVSAKLKSSEWGSKVVTQFAEYIRVHAPHLKGFSRANIYNFVMFYDEYSSPQFIATIKEYLPNGFVQSAIAQIEDAEIVQSLPVELEGTEIVQKTSGEIVQSGIGQLGVEEFVQLRIRQLPKFLLLTTYTNHLRILSSCSMVE